MAFYSPEGHARPIPHRQLPTCGKIKIWLPTKPEGPSFYLFRTRIGVEPSSDGPTSIRREYAIARVDLGQPDPG